LIVITFAYGFDGTVLHSNVVHNLVYNGHMVMVASAEATYDGWICWDCLGFRGLTSTSDCDPLLHSVTFFVWILPVNLTPLRGNPLVPQPVCWAC